jgi:hypothetical protein
VVGGGGIMNEDISVEVSSLVLMLGVGGGTVMVARNESRSKLIMPSLFRLFDRTVSNERRAHYEIL